MAFIYLMCTLIIRKMKMSHTVSHTHTQTYKEERRGKKRKNRGLLQSSLHRQCVNPEESGVLENI